MLEGIWDCNGQNMGSNGHVTVEFTVGVNPLQRAPRAPSRSDVPRLTQRATASRSAPSQPDVGYPMSHGTAAAARAQSRDELERTDSSTDCGARHAMSTREKGEMQIAPTHVPQDSRRVPRLSLDDHSERYVHAHRVEKRFTLEETHS